MILVAGGTGRLGSLVVDRLLGRNVAIRVLTRDAARAAPLPDSVEVVVGDVRDPASAARAVSGCDLVISAVHGFIGARGISPATVDRDGNANLTDAAMTAGAHLVLLSVVGASPDSPMELLRMKYDAEQYARASGVPTTIVRATAYVELWVELLRKTAGRSGRPLVFGRGDNRINFVSVTDVAALVDLVAADPSTRGETLEIGGPENITFNELARIVQRKDGTTGSLRHVPPAALRLLSISIGRVKPQLRRQLTAALAMDSADLRFDTTPIHDRYSQLPTTRVSELLATAG